MKIKTSGWIAIGITVISCFVVVFVPEAVTAEMAKIVGGGYVLVFWLAIFSE